MKSSTKNSIIVSFFIILRFALSPVSFYLIVYDYTVLAIITLIIVLTTDYLDGELVRTLKARPLFSFYLDPISDFVYIFISYLGLLVKGFILWAVLALIVLMFVQFVATSGLKRPIYDTVGKYYGIFLFVMIGVILIFGKYYIFEKSIGIILASAISLISRIKMLNDIKKIDKNYLI